MAARLYRAHNTAFKLLTAYLSTRHILLTMLIQIQRYLHTHASWQPRNKWEGVMDPTIAHRWYLSLQSSPLTRCPQDKMSIYLTDETSAEVTTRPSVLCSLNAITVGLPWVNYINLLTISSQPPMSLLGFLCILQTDTSSPYLAVDSRLNTYSRRAFLIAGPTVWNPRVFMTVLNSFLRQSSLVSSNVTSTLEVFLNDMCYVLLTCFTYLIQNFASIN